VGRPGRWLGQYAPAGCVGVGEVVVWVGGLEEL